MNISSAYNRCLIPRPSGALKKSYIKMVNKLGSGLVLEEALCQWYETLRTLQYTLMLLVDKNRWNQRIIGQVMPIWAHFRIKPSTFTESKLLIDQGISPRINFFALFAWAMAWCNILKVVWLSLKGWNPRCLRFRIFFQVCDYWCDWLWFFRRSCMLLMLRQ